MQIYSAENKAKQSDSFVQTIHNEEYIKIRV